MKASGRLGATLICAAAALAGCGSGAGGGGGSGSFITNDILATRDRANGDSISIYLESLSAVCALFASNVPTPSRDYDEIAIAFRTTTATVTTGVKTIVIPGGTVPDTPDQGTAFFTGHRACGLRYAGYATGSVDLTALDDTHVAGSYTLAFSDGWPFAERTISGTFDAPMCDLMGKSFFIWCE
jgi:hypothetical protein